MICYFNNRGGCVCHNHWQVAFFSSAYHNQHGLYVKQNNFRRSVSLYVARSVVVKTFVNEPDLYRKIE